MLGRRLPALVLVLISLAALGYAATLRVPDSKTNGANTGIFWSDEAVYHSMAYSFAYDGDIRYERGDLERVYAAGYSGGPSGIFLVRNPANGHLYYSKAWIYPLVAAPFVRLFGDNGFFVLHALLLAMMLAAGYAYARRESSSAVASLFTTTYVLASVVTLYFFWMTPEWFNCTLMFLATFLWLYKEAPVGPADTKWNSLLDGAWTDYAAALIYGLAIFSKPPNLLLVGPLLLWQLWRRRWGRAFVCGTLCAGVIVAMFAVTWAWIGSPNYQGGDRRQFNVNTSYPFMGPDKTFDSIGIDMTTNLEDLAAALPPLDTFARDVIYVWIGRNGGMVLYMFPAVLALVLFLSGDRRRPLSPRSLLAAFWLLEILAILLYVRGNWIGGGGTVGSRYFANVYPVLFFLLPIGSRVAASAASWVVWGRLPGPDRSEPGDRFPATGRAHDSFAVHPVPGRADDSPQPAVQHQPASAATSPGAAGDVPHLLPGRQHLPVGVGHRRILDQGRTRRRGRAADRRPGRAHQAPDPQSLAAQPRRGALRQPGDRAAHGAADGGRAHADGRRSAALHRGAQLAVPAQHLV